MRNFSHSHGQAGIAIRLNVWPPNADPALSVEGGMMSWRSTARWALAVWLGFVLWMAAIEALPWGRSLSVPVAEEGVLFGATVFLLPYIAWRMFQPVRTEATAALDGFVRRGDLPPDD